MLEENVNRLVAMLESLEAQFERADRPAIFEAELEQDYQHIAVYTGGETLMLHASFILDELQKLKTLLATSFFDGILPQVIDAFWVRLKRKELTIALEEYQEALKKLSDDKQEQSGDEQEADSSVDESATEWQASLVADRAELAQLPADQALSASFDEFLRALESTDDVHQIGSIFWQILAEFVARVHSTLTVLSCQDWAREKARFRDGYLEHSLGLELWYYSAAKVYTGLPDEAISAGHWCDAENSFQGERRHGFNVVQISEQLLLCAPPKSEEQVQDFYRVLADPLGGDRPVRHCIALGRTEPYVSQRRQAQRPADFYPYLPEEEEIGDFRVGRVGNTQVLHIPMDDGSALDPSEELVKRLYTVGESIKKDERVLVHCASSRGRTGMIILALMIYTQPERFLASESPEKNLRVVSGYVNEIRTNKRTGFVQNAEQFRQALVIAQKMLRFQLSLSPSHAQASSAACALTPPLRPVAAPPPEAGNAAQLSSLT